MSSHLVVKLVSSEADQATAHHGGKVRCLFNNPIHCGVTWEHGIHMVGIVMAGSVTLVFRWFGEVTCVKGDVVHQGAVTELPGRLHLTGTLTTGHLHPPRHRLLSNTRTHTHGKDNVDMNTYGQQYV